MLPRFFAILVLLLATPADAADLDNPISAGVVQVDIGSDPPAPGQHPIRSFSMEIDGVGTRVFCALIDANLGASGVTDVLTASPTDVFLVAYSHSGPNCDGAKSDPSDDRYRVVFAGPGKPFLRLVTPPLP